MAIYLITGGAGFIGSNIVAGLLARGETVRVLDNFLTGKRENLSPFIDDIELIEGDIRDLAVVQDAMRDVDFCLHQAALPSVPRSVEDPLLTNEINVGGTLNVLIAARDHGVRRVVYASSSSVYGDLPELPKREDMLPEPISPYAVSKLSGEIYAKVFFHLYNLETISLRYFNIFGPNQDETSHYAAVVPKFIDRLKRDQPPIVYGDGEQSRAFTYVANVVEANLLSCQAPGEAAGQVFNIAGRERITVSSLAREITSLMGKSLDPIHEAPREGDIRHSWADISKAARLLRYEPTVEFSNGLKKLIAAIV